MILDCLSSGTGSIPVSAANSCFAQAVPPKVLSSNGVGLHTLDVKISVKPSSRSPALKVLLATMPVGAFYGQDNG
jgi:hypothetical protein